MILITFTKLWYRLNSSLDKRKVNKKYLINGFTKLQLTY